MSTLRLSTDARLAIISGAQTGVDRGALDAALEAGVPCGGWVPRGRLAEDGPVPSRYPVQELAEGGYRQRTKANVLASDGTVLIYFSRLHGGTALTLRLCIDNNKPYLLVDASELTAQRAAERIATFAAANSIRCLNVAGPRESNVPGSRNYAYTAIKSLVSSEAAAK